MNKFDQYWAQARDTRDCAVYDRAVNGMLNSASNSQQYNAAKNLALNGKTPLIIEALNQLTKTEKED